MEEIIKKADVLIEALPYIQKFRGKRVVIKYGGNLMENGNTFRSILLDIVLMSSVGMKPLLVHGGGNFITERLTAEKKESKFVNGLRITDAETIKVVEEVLTGLNRKIVQQIAELKGKAEGVLSEDKLFKAKKTFFEEIDPGFVGEVIGVEKGILERLLSQDFIPVIVPIGIGEDQKHYNLNADTAAAEVATTINAEKLVFISDVKGIMGNPEDSETMISVLTEEEAKTLVEEKVITGGMLPKVKAALKSLKSGVRKVHIVDGRISHSILLEIFTNEGIGTEIVLERKEQK